MALGGWSLSLAVWAVPALLAIAVWAPIAYRAGGGTRTARRTVLPWRDGFARLAACYLAGSSLMVYGWLTWLPPYYESLGWSPQSAGVLLAVWSIAHIPAALAIPALAERRRRWRFWSGLTLSLITIGTLGALVAPDPPLIGPWLWVTLIGLGSGAGFALGLTMIAWRTPDGATSTATSSVALGIGYTIAGLGPLLMGLLIDLSGFPAAIVVLLVAAGAVAAAIVAIGDPPAPPLGGTQA